MHKAVPNLAISQGEAKSGESETARLQPHQLSMGTRNVVKICFRMKSYSYTAKASLRQARPRLDRRARMQFSGVQRLIQPGWWSQLMGERGAYKQKRHIFSSFIGGPNWPFKCYYIFRCFDLSFSTNVLWLWHFEIQSWEWPWKWLWPHKRDTIKTNVQSRDYFILSYYHFTTLSWLPFLTVT